MPRREVRITGFGGQGVILTGYIFGRAAAIFDGLHATMTQSFGPEARGSACSASLVIDDEVIAYPYPRRTDLLIAMSREGYEKYRPELKDDGVLVFDSDMVHPNGESLSKHGVAAARIAEELGKRIVQNIVVVGFTAAATGLVSMQAARQSVEASVPEALLDLNLKAFEAGYGCFRQ